MCWDFNSGAGTSLSDESMKLDEVWTVESLGCVPHWHNSLSHNGRKPTTNLKGSVRWLFHGQYLPSCHVCGSLRLNNLNLLIFHKSMNGTNNPAKNDIEKCPEIR